MYFSVLTTLPPCLKIRPTSTLKPTTGLWLMQSGPSSVYFLGWTMSYRALLVAVTSYFLVPQKLTVMEVSVAATWMRMPPSVVLVNLLCRSGHEIVASRPSG